MRTPKHQAFLADVDGKVSIEDADGKIITSPSGKKIFEGRRGQKIIRIQFEGMDELKVKFKSEDEVMVKAVQPAGVVPASHIHPTATCSCVVARTAR